jgi:rhodanese-related sulfurtransferase
MPKTFAQMVSEATGSVPALKPAEAKRRMQNPNTLMIDVRDAADITVTGIIPGAVNISYGALTYKADSEVPQEWRDPQLQDHARPIITTCEVGPLGALGAKLLKDMGFTNVACIEGGTQGWKQESRLSSLLAFGWKIHRIHEKDYPSAIYASICMLVISRQRWVAIREHPERGICRKGRLFDAGPFVPRQISTELLALR